MMTDQKVKDKSIDAYRESVMENINAAARILLTCQISSSDDRIGHYMRSRIKDVRTYNDEALELLGKLNGAITVADAKAGESKMPVADDEKIVGLCVNAKRVSEWSLSAAHEVHDAQLLMTPHARSLYERAKKKIEGVPSSYQYCIMYMNKRPARWQYRFNFAIGSYSNTITLQFDPNTTMDGVREIARDYIIFTHADKIPNTYSAGSTLNYIDGSDNVLTMSQSQPGAPGWHTTTIYSKKTLAELDIKPNSTFTLFVGAELGCRIGGLVHPNSDTETILETWIGWVLWSFDAAKKIDVTVLTAADIMTLIRLGVLVPLITVREVQICVQELIRVGLIDPKQYKSD